MSNEHALEIPLDQLRAAFHHHNLCRKEAGVGDDDVLLDRIKEMNAEISRLRETIIANSAIYESERFALNSEIDDLRKALEDILNTSLTKDDARANRSRFDKACELASEALTAHAPVEGEKPV